MTFDVYFPVKLDNGTKVPGKKAQPRQIGAILEMMRGKMVADVITRVRNGEKEAKKELPAICWVGKSRDGKRRADSMEPTQFVMIDIDHVENCVEANAEITSAMISSGEYLGIGHITPSGHGLRYVIRACEEGYDTLQKYMEHLNERYHFDKYGDFDTAVKDLSRMSFMPRYEDVLYLNIDLLEGNTPIDVFPIQTPSPTLFADESGEQSEPSGKVSFTAEEEAEFSQREYNGIKYQMIIDDYLKVFGTPGSGDIHNYYNEMVKNFRCICDNNKKFLLWLLPRFGHSMDECWSQIISICRVNTLSRLPKEFYFFLKDHGYYKRRDGQSEELRKQMLAEEEIQPKVLDCPYLPPVFRELVGTAPSDFVPSCINALLPVMGTLTSYLRAVYPYDNREHSTSFFSVIYAPAGTGKGFVERFLDLLFEDLKIRDLVQSERENVYLRAMNKKGANDKSPDQPHTSLRIIPAKNSEPEFLQKQRDNHGYHMFTYAAEMDSWAKGVRAAGGNKDDMIRIAWDNGEYGQQFKSWNTFKGMVRLYWNVLITGTIAQVENYFKNVENGLVTRCGFTSIENQEFALPPEWGTLNKKKMDVIRRFRKRCDERTYKTPCEITPDMLMSTSDADFDNDIDWQFQFREPQRVDMKWIMPTIDAFNQEQMNQAAKDVDRARDVFRRRVAVRGFRLALMCVGLYEKPRPIDLENCSKFVNWWMHIDIESSLKLWGSRYNSLVDANVLPTAQPSLFSSLGDKFTKEDIYVQCVKQGIKSPVRRIIFDWNKIGCIKKVGVGLYEKINKKSKK